MDSLYQEYERREQERREARSSGQFVGFLLIALFTMQIVMVVIMTVLGAFGVLNMKSDTYGFNNTEYLLFQMLTYLFYLVVPAMFVALIARRYHNPFASERAPRGSYIIAIFGGMALSAFANVVASYLSMFLTNMGVPEPNFPDSTTTTVLSLVLNLVASALFPAILEEMVFRGYVLRVLRPHGEKMAVVLSALVFGLIHGNIEQVPFATILGIALGWLVVRTGSIWPAVVLHGVNNGFAVTQEWLRGRFPDSTTITGAGFMVFCVGGALVFAVLFANKTAYHRDMVRPMGNEESYLTVGQRVRAIVTAPAFIAGVVLWILLLLLSMISQ